MDKVGIVRKDEVQVQTLVDHLKKIEKIKECGAIVLFIGIVREVGHDAYYVKELQYEAAEQEALQILNEIRSKTLEKNPGIKELLIYHVVDVLKPTEDTVYVAAIGAHREDAFEAAREALEEVKSKPPIWKKEVTEKQAYWVDESGR